MKNTLTSAIPGGILVWVGSGGGKAGRDALTVNTRLTGAAVAGRARVQRASQRPGSAGIPGPGWVSGHPRAVQTGLTGSP
jgi:hypothetical protein